MFLKWPVSSFEFEFFSFLDFMVEFVGEHFFLDLFLYRSSRDFLVDLHVQFFHSYSMSAASHHLMA